jgi:uncharacterized membrane protein
MNAKTPFVTNRWTVLIAAVAINLILGVLYAWGVLLKALVNDWHWTRTDATMPMSVATVCFAGMMVFAGRDARINSARGFLRRPAASCWGWACWLRRWFIRPSRWR